MPSTCVFEFDRPEPVYYSGETINGRIVLTTTSDKSCREVYIRFKGAAKTHWQESKSRTVNGKTEHYTEHYSGNETYLETRTPVYGEGTLPAGQHVYTFCIPLPLECPSSCVEQYGEIKYSIYMVINRPYRFDNEFTQSLTVLKQVNLNLMPELLVPLKDEEVKHFCCFPCSSGPVLSTLVIPFGGYAPGQSIDYSLTIDNQSSKYDLDGIELEFRQTYSFTATYPRHKTRYHTVTLANACQSERVLRLSKRILEGGLTIPPVPPTSSNSGIITVYYDILMAIKTGSCHTDSEMTLPIKIGTVPLAQSARNPENIAMFMPSAPTPDTPDTPGDRPPSYDLIKPPSFEEATSIKTPFVDTDGDGKQAVEGFIPKYPMYTNFALPTAPQLTDNIDATDGARPSLNIPYPTSHTPLMQPLPPNSGIGWRS